MALRTAKSLQHRTPLPMQFIQEVNEKVSVLKQDGEPDDSSYLDHKVLKQEHDEQLLLWMQRYFLFFVKFYLPLFVARYPKDWDIPTTFNFSIFGWGHNHRGQLGGIDGNKVKVPRICDAFGEISPVQITGGEQTLFAVTADGKVCVCVCVCVCVHVCARY